MTPAPHPFRCETCGKYPCNMIKNFDPEGVQMGREHAGDGCISIVGCASHSNATTEQKEYIVASELLYNKVYLHGYNHKAWETVDKQVFSRPYNPSAIRQDEREKVLKELDTQLQEKAENLSGYSFIPERTRGQIIGLLDARTLIKELRQQSGERDQ